MAIYPFAEHAGKVIHSQLSSGVNSKSPNIIWFFIRIFCNLSGSAGNWAFWKDRIINIAGFIPLWFFIAYIFLCIGPLAARFC